MKFKRYKIGTSLVGPMVETSFSNAGDVGWIHGRGESEDLTCLMAKISKIIKNGSNVVAKFNRDFIFFSLI